MSNFQFQHQTQQESHFIRHEPCPKCGSSDALSRYSDHVFCFSCNHYAKGTQEVNQVNQVNQGTEVNHSKRQLEMTGTTAAIQDRRISLDVAKRYGVTVEQGAQGTITKHHYPYYSRVTKAVVGTKVRNVATKDFYATGSLSEAGLFGQQAFASGGKYITVTEGELDALAVNEMFDGKWPAVSIRSGAASAVKDIKASLEYLETFDNVVICFDNDEAGIKAAEAVVSLFSPRKAKVCSLPLKDAGDMLKANQIRAFVKCWWEAKAYRPEGIISFGDDDLWDSFVKRGTEEVIPFPSCFEGLNIKMNGGIAAGELTVIGALTSIGKSTMVSNLVCGFSKETSSTVGCIFLEASPAETVENLVSVQSGINIKNIPQEMKDYVAYKKIYDQMGDKNNLHLLNHCGSLESEDLFAKIQFLIKGMDCDIIVIDPLQAGVVSNENASIDDFMDRCLKLIKNTNVSMILISHMRQPRVGQRPHDVGEYDLKGSSSINQIAFNTILLSRDKMSEDEYERNCTQVQLVKCRRTGRTGVAGWLYYEDNTSRLIATTAPEIKIANSHEDF